MKTDKELMKKIVKKGVAMVAAGAMVFSFAGCGKKEAILSKTDLEKAVVMTIDNETIIGKPYDKKVWHSNDFGTICLRTHYQDVVTGNIYHVIPLTTEEVKKSEKLVDVVRREKGCGKLECFNVFEDELLVTSLTNKLTEEELKKASNDEFTDEDLIKAQQRIAKESNTKTLG